ncbi:uncharacterized protein ACA1_032000 [Acanthamoeba castellanii str. Neff]|uniref:Uncharacterized protein n=1 Tax=Acanthamoeba castellanii (strain ATCC 30010 / Neff) TaxID=1257118 RepID=L8H417_ACACF|nr:uncharacterized protein ACA1_032000 [Acanthamoeba castellanii str. Neff]ELR19176.1 hypothetical protein ACA1_032000 [Acanthamoeba castellanii str. Neff]
MAYLEGLWMLGASFLGTLFLFITWFHPAFSLNEVFFFSIVFSILSSSWIGFIVQGFWYNEFNEQGIIISNAFFTVLVLLYAKSAYKKIKMSIENFRFITAASTNAAYMSGKGSNSPYAEMFREYVRNGNGLMFHIFALLCFIMFYTLFDHHSLSIGEDGASYSGGGCWGDIAFHLDIISSFLYGPNVHFKPWALSNPIYSGTTLQYTLLPDYHSAMLIKGGFSVRHAFFGPGVLMSWSICCLLYFYTFRFTEGSKAAGWLAVAFFCFSGGVGFFSWIHKHGMTWSGLVDNDFAQHWEYGELFWFQTITHVLVPQRPALFGYPGVLMIFILLWTATSAPLCHSLTLKEKKRIFIVAGIVAGMLPFFQAHSWMGVMAVLGVYGLSETFKWVNEPFYFLNWLRFGIIAVVWAFPQFVVFAQRGKEWGFAQFKPLWTDPSFSGTGNPIMFWFYSLGFFVFLSLGFFFILNGKQKQWYLGHLALFAFANLFLLQPWTKDNIKIINIYMFGASSVVGLGLVRLFNRDSSGVKGRRDKLSAPSPILTPHQRLEQSQSILAPFYDSPVVVKFNEFCANPFFQTATWATALKVVVILLVVSMCFTGVISVIREPNLHWRFQDNEDLATGQWIIDHTDPYAVFATSEGHIVPVSTNAGRQHVAGYPGWLYSHAYNGWYDRTLHVKEMWAGDQKAYERFKEYNVSYMLREWHMTVNEAFLSECCSEQYRSDSGRYAIYKVERTEKPQPPQVEQQ